MCLGGTASRGPGGCTREKKQNRRLPPSALTQQTRSEVSVHRSDPVDPWDQNRCIFRPGLSRTGNGRVVASSCGILGPTLGTVEAQKKTVTPAPCGSSLIPAVL